MIIKWHLAFVSLQLRFGYSMKKSDLLVNSLQHYLSQWSVLLGQPVSRAWAHAWTEDVPTKVYIAGVWGESNSWCDCCGGVWRSLWGPQHRDSSQPPNNRYTWSILLGMSMVFQLLSFHARLTLSYFYCRSAAIQSHWFFTVASSWPRNGEQPLSWLPCKWRPNGWPIHSRTLCW